MWIAGFHHRHDASLTLLKDGEVKLYTEEERFSGEKHCWIGSNIKQLVSNYTDRLDFLGTWYCKTRNKLEYHDIPSIQNTRLVRMHEHHLLHASCAFYNSGFEEAVCIVADGSGLRDGRVEEKESIYLASYPANFKTIWKNGFDEKPIAHSEFGTAYRVATTTAGFARQHQHGKFMGLTSYSNKRIPFNNFKEDILYKIPNYKEQFQESADYANTVQEYLQEQMLELIKFAVKKTGCKNVCISGGFGLNVRANYYYRKNLPIDVNLYCEPLCYDGGISMGLAKYIHHKVTGDMTIRKQESLYLGNDK